MAARTPSDSLPAGAVPALAFGAEAACPARLAGRVAGRVAGGDKPGPAAVAHAKELRGADAMSAIVGWHEVAELHFSGNFLRIPATPAARAASARTAAATRSNTGCHAPPTSLSR
ncbi:hypothetical protein ACU4GD_12545 [Cupriavidus basilensis]